MDIRIFKKLLIERLITHDEFEKIQLHEQEPVSVHWDLRTLLYLGIVLLTTSLGIIVYKNIDTIGHDVIVIAIALLCTACFQYSFKNSNGYSNKKITSSNTWFDYILLMGCLLLLTFVGYLQFVNLAAWVGISVTPLQMLKENDFSNARLIYSGIVLGTLLVAVSFASVYKNIKAHFYFTFKNFGCHILLISLLAAMFYFENYYLLWFLLLSAACFLFFKNALKENSFYFLVITILYAYIELSYVVIQLLFSEHSGDISIYSAIIYFILSGIGLIWLLIHYNKILKANAGI